MVSQNKLHPFRNLPTCLLPLERCYSPLELSCCHDTLMVPPPFLPKAAWHCMDLPPLSQPLCNANGLYLCVWGGGSIRAHSSKHLLSSVKLYKICYLILLISHSFHGSCLNGLQQWYTDTRCCPQIPVIRMWKKWQSRSHSENTYKNNTVTKACPQNKIHDNKPNCMHKQ
jgi:hypothetical protein